MKKRENTTYLADMISTSVLQIKENLGKTFLKTKRNI